MTHREFVQWIEYFNRHGRLTPRRMFDLGWAQICVQIAGVHGHKRTVEDYLPKSQPSVDPMSSFESFAKQFPQAKVKRGRSR